MIYVCFARGMADFMPNTQDYDAFDGVAPLVAAIAAHVQRLEDDHEAAGVYNYPIPRHVLDGWNRGAQGSWRVAIAKDADDALDVITVTADEFARESME